MDKIRKTIKRNGWKKFLLWLILGAGAILLLDVGCVFRRVTGIPCPGCGMTRAHLAALRLNFKAAFFYHPLWPLPIPLIILSILRPEGPFRGKKANNRFWGILFLLLILTYLIRMLLFFPDTPPMDYNWNSVLGKILQAVLKK